MWLHIWGHFKAPSQMYERMKPFEIKQTKNRLSLIKSNQIKVAPAIVLQEPLWHHLQTRTGSLYLCSPCKSARVKSQWWLIVLGNYPKYTSSDTDKRLNNSYKEPLDQLSLLKAGTDDGSDFQVCCWIFTIFVCCVCMCMWGTTLGMYAMDGSSKAALGIEYLLGFLESLSHIRGPQNKLSSFPSDGKHNGMPEQ